MKTILLSLLWLCSVTLSAQTSLMTYNLRYANPDDGENYWEERKKEVVGLIRYYQPDILGAQEVTHAQLEYLKQSLPGYQTVGVGRDDGATAGEYSPIFFNTAQFELVRTETYWLSETPETPSKGWDAAIKRIVTYVILKHRESRRYYAVFNTHFDHIGEMARQQSAQLIKDLIYEQQWSEYPVIVMGDFNSEPQSVAIATLKQGLNDSYEQTMTLPYGPAGTFNNFDSSAVPGRRIDYIFTKNLQVLNHRHIDDRRQNGLWVSDHLPVLVTVQLEGE